MNRYYTAAALVILAVTVIAVLIVTWAVLIETGLRTS